jgi:hypothetical protein
MTSSMTSGMATGDNHTVMRTSYSYLHRHLETRERQGSYATRPRDGATGMTGALPGRARPHLVVGLAALSQ